MAKGMVIKHYQRSAIANSQFLLKKDITRDPYVVVNQPKVKKDDSSSLERGVASLDIDSLNK